MARDKTRSALWSALISFCLSFGSLGCMASGLGLLDGGEYGLLAICCAVFALAFSGLYLLRLAPWVALACLLIPVGCWLLGDLEASVERVVYDISYLYHAGYGWKVIFWSDNPLAASALQGLVMAGLLVTLPICHTLNRRGSVLLALPLTLAAIASTLLLTDTVPHAPYLGLYLFGLLLLMLSQGVRRRDPRQANALCLRACLPLVLVLGLIFGLNPKKSYDKQYLALKLEQGVLSLVEKFSPPPEPDTPQATPGGIHMPTVGDTGSSVSLENVGPKSRKTQVVMTVTASATGTVYLRGASYAAYDGLSWDIGNQRDTISQWPKFWDTTPLHIMTVTTRSQHSVLYMPYYSPEVSRLYRGKVENSDHEKTYQFTYRSGPMETQSDSRVDEDYTYLPESTAQWAGELTQVLVGPVRADSAASVYTAAQTIGQYVGNSASYSLETPRMPAGEDDFVQWFLESCDTGYCIHFASAATVLLRSAGIPARYVTGYLVKTQAEESVDVLLADAHAWVEYYVPGGGWQILDPTPGGNPGSQQPPVATTPGTTTPAETTPDPSEPTLPGQTTAPTLPGQTPGPSQGGSDTVPDDDGPQQGDVPGEKKNRSLAWLRWILWPLLLAAVVVGQWQVRVQTRKKRLRSGRINRRALAYWRELSRLAQLAGQEVPREIEDLALKAKFSQHTLSREEMTQLRGYLARCQHTLQRQGFVKQLLYRLVYALY